MLLRDFGHYVNSLTVLDFVNHLASGTSSGDGFGGIYDRQQAWRTHLSGCLLYGYNAPSTPGTTGPATVVLTAQDATSTAGPWTTQGTRTLSLGAGATEIGTGLDQWNLDLAGYRRYVRVGQTITFPATSSGGTSMMAWGAFIAATADAWPAT